MRNPDDLARLLTYGLVFGIGDTTVSKVSGGWTIVRDDAKSGRLILRTDGQWWRDEQLSPNDPWRCFADVVTAMALAEQSYIKRTGENP